MNRRERGIAVYARQFGVSPEEAERLFVERYGERMADEAFHASGGGNWEPDVLSLRDRSLVVVTALAAQGGVEERLRSHVRWALVNGATPEELDALVSLLAVYVGYPRASVAMEVVRDELAAVNNQKEA
jgi:4-carboxymuconolactone decarboxylase